MGNTDQKTQITCSPTVSYRDTDIVFAELGKNNLESIISKDLKSSGTMPECPSRVRPARLRGRERGKERE